MLPTLETLDEGSFPSSSKTRHDNGDINFKRVRMRKLRSRDTGSEGEVMMASNGKIFFFL